MNIKKLNEIKTALAKILEIEKVEFRSVTDEAGNIISWTKDLALPEVGDELYVEGREADEKELAPEGEYITVSEIGEQVKITVGEKGIITSIEVVEIEEPEAPEVEEPAVEVEETAEETPEMPAEEPEAPEVTEDETNELEAEIEALNAEIEALKAENEELKKKIEELESEPAQEPVEEQFEAITKKQKKSGAAKYFAALNK